MIWNRSNVYFEVPTLSQCVFIENNVKNNRLTFIVQHNIQLKSAVFSEKHFRNIYQVWHGFLFLVLFVSLDYCSAFENSCCNCFTGFLLFFLFQNCIMANNNWNGKHLKNSSWLFFFFFFLRCCCGRLVRQHAGFTASLATKYSDVKLGESSNVPMPELEEWSVEKHTEARPTDAYGVINFQGGSHSYRAKVRG